MSSEPKNGTGGGQDGATVLFNDGLQYALFIVFWVVAVPVWLVIDHLSVQHEYNSLWAYHGAFLGGVVGAGIFIFGYVGLVRRLPIYMQRPYYRHWKQMLLEKARRREMHPFVDIHMERFILNELDTSFEMGGIRVAERGLNYFFNMVLGSTEFALVMADELRQVMPHVQVTVISLPEPPKPPKES